MLRRENSWEEYLARMGDGNWAIICLSSGTLHHVVNSSSDFKHCPVKSNMNYFCPIWTTFPTYRIFLDWIIPTILFELYKLLNSSLRNILTFPLTFPILDPNLYLKILLYTYNLISSLAVRDQVSESRKTVNKIDILHNWLILSVCAYFHF
jgi:hypothetical protein